MAAVLLPGTPSSANGCRLVLLIGLLVQNYWCIDGFQLFRPDFYSTVDRRFHLNYDSRRHGEPTTLVPSDAKIDVGESWIRLPTAVNDINTTATFLETLLQDMFFGGDDTSDSFFFANNQRTIRTMIGINPDVAWSWSCVVPALDNSLVCVELMRETNLMVLSMNATNSQDFGWVCSLFYSQRKKLDEIGIDCETSLRKIVAMFFNELPPEKGLQASLSAWSQEQVDHFEKCLNGRPFMQTLDEKGYIVIDGAIHTALPPQNELHASLESLFLELTDQGDRVRTDRVLFVSSLMASVCGLGSANTFLRGIAHYLNQDERSTFKVKHEELLTLPDRLQFAEYGHHDFYKAHRDNSLSGVISSNGAEVRSNFRAYTCILYLNDNEWDLSRDGGALRIYPGTERKASLSSLAGQPFVDVCPGPYGRLIVFDSRAIHSVEPVMRTDGRRRALTLWINRPVDSDLVPGETYF